jgi:hypothetical protein
MTLFGVEEIVARHGCVLVAAHVALVSDASCLAANGAVIVLRAMVTAPVRRCCRRV